MIEFDKEQHGKTNLDRLREMSAEEIGEWVESNRHTCNFCTVCPANSYCAKEYDKICTEDDYPDVPCAKYIANWLNQPYEGAKNDE